ncbi:MAG: CHAT domain-containing protein [Candidatus Aminicenantes bacterium]|nr:CHAT domain-containing protein [Candidatus Aminicenantes bacterium]
MPRFGASPVRAVRVVLIAASSALAAALAVCPATARPSAPGQAAEQAVLKNAQEKARAGDFDGALRLYASAADAGRKSGDKRLEMSALAGMGRCYSRQYESGKAVESYTKALAVARAIPDREAEFEMLLGAGSAAAWTGDTDAALEFLNAAAAAARKSGDKDKLERALNAVGSVHYQAGEFDVALESYRQAVEVGRSMEGGGHEGFILVNMGEIHRRVHEYEKARSAYERAGAFARRIGNANLEWASVRSLGTVAYETGRMEEARRAYARALELCRERKNREGLAGTHLALGKVDLAEKKLESAWKHFESAKGIYEESGSNLVMHPLNYMGDVRFFEGRTEQAIDFYGKSLDLAEKMHVFNYLIEMNYKIARALDASGDRRRALSHYIRSAQHIESVRGRMGGESFRVGFLKGYIEVYEHLIGLLLRLHEEDGSRKFDRLAFAYAEKAKARAFLDGLEEARIDLLSAASPELRAEKLRLSRSTAQTLAALQKPGLDEERRARFLSDLGRAEEEYDLFMERIRREHPRYGEVQAEPPDLDRIQDRLPNDHTALVEFFFGEESAFAFLVTKKSLQACRLGEVSGLNRAVENYLLFLRSASNDDLRTVSRGLGARLFPFASRISAEVDRLIVVPDASLYHLPFETLVVDRPGAGRRLLLETCALSTAPSAASLIALEARPSRSGFVFDLAGFGSPRYAHGAGQANETASGGALRGSHFGQGLNLPPLPFSGREIRNSARFFGSDRVRLFLGDKASEAALKKNRPSDFRIVHLAVHGLIDEEVASRSMLVFSRTPEAGEDGLLTAREVYELDIPADLVVLSACATARGKIEKGEGVCGLGRAFFYAGAKTVVASLWNVRDRPTSAFMPRFYKYWTEGRTKEEALRRAKLDFMSSGSPPSVWAAFILIGEGRGRLTNR